MNKRYTILLFLGMLFISSCKTPGGAVKKDLNYRSDAFLIEVLEANEFKYSWLSSKASFTFTNPKGKKNSFKASVRIRKDSAIWISITPLFGIEMARVLITKDTVKMINRMDSKYFIGDIDYLNDKFNVELEYEVLQSLLTGNSVTFDNNSDKIETAVDKKKGLYFIGTVKKRKLRKALRKDKLDKEVQSLWIDPESYKVREMMLNDFETDRSLAAVYSEHKDVDGQLFPFNVRFDINVEKEKAANVEVKYSRINYNKPVKMLFSIPDKYEQIYY